MSSRAGSLLYRPRSGSPESGPTSGYGSYDPEQAHRFAESVLDLLTQRHQATLASLRGEAPTETVAADAQAEGPVETVEATPHLSLRRRIGNFALGVVDKMYQTWDRLQDRRAQARREVSPYADAQMPTEGTIDLDRVPQGGVVLKINRFDQPGYHSVSHPRFSEQEKLAA